jgi:carbamate kinase
VVVSPKPVTIVEKREIEQLIGDEFIVICCGGGGIPVIREGRRFCGVDAVIDKDLVSAKLGQEIGADVFVIATDVPGACLNFRTEKQRLLSDMTCSQARNYLQQGQYEPGSMEPKIQACINFIDNGGSMATITHLSQIEAALEGSAGTTFTS